MRPDNLTKSVLVIGLNRSGTKWLSNLIAEHHDVYAVQHEKHFGILESNVFNDFGRMFPSLETIEARTSFESVWNQTDFINITNVDLHKLMQSNRPTSVFEAFKLLMGEAAAQRGAKYWLQKCSPVQLATVGSHFADAKKIFIKRKFNDVMVSAIENSKASRGQSGELRLALNYCLQNQVLNNAARQSDVLCISYEELKANSQKTIATVFDFLGLDANQIQESEYTPNTSFSGSKVPQQLKASTKLFSIMLRTFLSLMPAGLPYRLWKRLRRNAPPSILRGTYRITRETIETPSHI